MSKVWYCTNCGYEVGGRGRCHACGEKLVASELPELEARDEDDEVGYRLGGWGDRDRGRLIEYLNVLSILHRFEDDELVVAAEDEQRVDDLIAELLATTGGAGSTSTGEAGEAVVEGGRPVVVAGGGPEPVVALLADAARRLRVDPTDMEADSDVAEASTAVFLADSVYGIDAENWAAVGRVTRRLLAALGADEAMEDEIRLQASILGKLLESVSDGGGGAAVERRLAVGTVYELPEWMPEQRSHLSVLLDDGGVTHEWDGDDLVVDSAREHDAEALFEQVGGVAGNSEDEYDDSDEVRYRVIEELFNSSGRLASDPEDIERRAEASEWAEAAQGPAPVGMDEVYWLRIMNRVKSLLDSLETDDADSVGEHAGALHELLRSVV